MAKLVVKEVYEGTNEEIREIVGHLNEILESHTYEDRYGDVFASVDFETDYDPENGFTKDTPLQMHLRKELNAYRSILNADAIARAEELIEEAAHSTLTAEEVADLEEQAPTLLAELDDDGSSDDEYEFDEDDFDFEDDEDEDDEEENFTRTDRNRVVKVIGILI
jgi:hypothetical protein